MKSDDLSLAATLNRYLRKSGSPSPRQVTASVEKVWEQLRPEAENTPLTDGKVMPRRFRFTVAFAMLVATAAIGLLAAQRSGLFPSSVSAPPAPVPPGAPSEKPRSAPETSMVKAVPRGSREETWTIAAAQVAAAQSTDAGAGRLEFAAASVRRQRRVDGQPGVINCRGVDGELFPTPDFLRDALSPTPQGRCIVDGRIDAVIGRAFSSAPMRANAVNCCVVGVPDALLQPPTFVIQATTENPSRVTKAELKQMLQTLLIDRFKLKFHREMRDQDGYIMTIANSGIKFKETSGAEQNPGLLSNMPATERNQITQFGGLVPLVMKGNFSIAGIVKNLESSFLLKPLADKTGLAGVYEMILNIQRLERPASAGPRSTGTPTAAEFVPPLPQAFEQQLGLLLTPAKVPVEYLIIERIEMPSEN